MYHLPYCPNRLRHFASCFAVLLCIASSAQSRGESLRIATFAVDATPEVGSPLAYDPMVKVTEPLSLKGVILVPPEQEPIVLCAVDWLGVACGSNTRFCEALARGAGTTSDRVVMHALHQHDAPRCNHDAIALLRPFDIAQNHFDAPFINDVIARAGKAAADSLAELQTVTSIEYGQAQVQKVASNRRMLSPDGTVHTTRYTACKDPKVAALPIGVIDPILRSIRFNHNDQTIAVLTFYATHPQSFYRVGEATPDFPGMARNAREKETGVFHLHFNGAGGNIGAGKYNDGSRANRPVLAARVEDGMKRAWDNSSASSNRIPAKKADALVQWDQEMVLLPLSEAIDIKGLQAEIADSSLDGQARCHAAEKLAYALRVQDGKGVPVSRLKIDDLQIVFLPGELFVEYQLAAAAMRPDQKVIMAAYGDYGTQYIGTRVAYPQGGYEVSPRATNVSPNAEAALIKSLETLLDATVPGVKASDFTQRTGPGLPPN